VPKYPSYKFQGKFESRARRRDRPYYFVIDSEGHEIGVYDNIGQARKVAQNSAVVSGQDYTVLAETEDISVLDASYGPQGRKTPNTHALARYYGRQAQASEMSQIVST